MDFYLNLMFSLSNFTRQRSSTIPLINTSCIYGTFIPFLATARWVVAHFPNQNLSSVGFVRPPRSDSPVESADTGALFWA